MIRFGIVGGGNVAAIHRRAAALDNAACLSAGCLSRDRETNHRLGAAWNIPEDRIYDYCEEMAEQEAARPDSIDFAVVATPNSSHFPIAAAFLRHGIHVLCEKPMTTTVQEAQALQALADSTGSLLCVNYSYSGYPMLHQARAMIRNGQIGQVVKVVAEYRQDNQILPGSTVKSWHYDPQISGPGGCVADIGTHIAYLASFVTDLQIEEVSAMLTNTIPEIPLDTDFSAMIRFQGGAVGTLWGSKVAVGDDCGIRLHVIGTLGSLQWSHRAPDQLIYAPLGGPLATYTAGRSYLAPEVQVMCRLSSGHMEGHFSAIGNLYRAFIADVAAKKAGEPPSKDAYPDGTAGLDGVAWIQACCASSRAGGAWTRLHTDCQSDTTH